MFSITLHNNNRLLQVLNNNLLLHRFSCCVAGSGFLVRVLQ